MRWCMTTSSNTMVGVLQFVCTISSSTHILHLMCAQHILRLWAIAVFRNRFVRLSMKSCAMAYPISAHSSHLSLLLAVPSFSCLISVSFLCCFVVRAYRDGDLINIDVSVYVDGWHGDCSATFTCGTVDPASQKLIATTKRAMDLAIAACKPVRSKVYCCGGCWLCAVLKRDHSTLDRE